MSTSTFGRRLVLSALVGGTAALVGCSGRPSSAPTSGPTMTQTPSPTPSAQPSTSTASAAPSSSAPATPSPANQAALDAQLRQGPGTTTWLRRPG